jgi:hypothetical protein
MDTVFTDILILISILKRVLVCTHIEEASSLQRCENNLPSALLCYET